MYSPFSPIKTGKEKALLDNRNDGENSFELQDGCGHTKQKKFRNGKSKNLFKVDASILSAITCGRPLKIRNENSSQERRFPHRSRTAPVRFGYHWFICFVKEERCI